MPTPPNMAKPIIYPCDAVLREIAAERHRQVDAEGWTPEHDDGHTEGEMAAAAACYAYAGSLAKDFVRERLTHPTYPGSDTRSTIKFLWPWDLKWWKPRDPRRDLVRAGALIVAEIERLDRAAAKTTT